MGYLNYMDVDKCTPGISIGKSVANSLLVLIFYYDLFIYNYIYF